MTVEDRRMNPSDYYREDAAKLPECAEMGDDAKQKLVELAEACEAIANNIDALRASR